MDNKVYGYVRISTKKQSLQRQIDNIRNYVDSNGIKLERLYEEKFTGTKIEGRKEFQKLLDKVKKGDTIIFDSVSRMSRNATDGIALYEELFDKGIELIFLKEEHINTETYKKALGTEIAMTNTDVDFILEGINKYIKALAKRQILIAFEQSEKEVKDLQQRTKEGLRVAKEKGVELGLAKGTKLTTKKSIEKKELIKKYSKDFDGSLNDKDTMELIKLARNTYYKYKKELLEEGN